MDEATRQKYEAKSTQLRAELKQFEADWAGRNSGKKPGRHDIKQNPSIASKYKKYNEVRDILAGKLPAPSTMRKRSADEAASITPSKRHRPMQTPSKVRTIDYEAHGIYQTPSSRTLFSPALPTSIGPTPQKNGKILGLFDLLEENTENAPPNGAMAGTNIQATPSKEPPARLDFGRSPMTPSKRNTLNAFMTPRGRKDGDNPLGARTPSSVSKLHLSTPAFLRRAPLPPVDEDGCYKSPEPVRLPRKPLGRSLSSVVASLRKLEEEKLDDELEALREMEEEEAEGETCAAKPAARQQKVAQDILEPDSQTNQLLGGFDDEGLYDSPTEEGKGRDGQPLRVYKKKGQKRTTRRVNMKPTRAKRPDKQDDGEGGDGDDEVIPETQFDPNKPVEDMAEVDSGSDFAASDAEDAEEDDEAPTKKQSKTVDKSASKDKKVKAVEKEGKVKKAARKVNELAHANFKRLKLRNTGTKGGPGFGSRFRRRR
ncbi:DNA replication/checkpoint protein [Poronia punctata]|nr:DNA replication/checkpoint protein [Poronia punctata]